MAICGHMAIWPYETPFLSSRTKRRFEDKKRFQKSARKTVLTVPWAWSGLQRASRRAGIRCRVFQPLRFFVLRTPSAPSFLKETKPSAAARTKNHPREDKKIGRLRRPAGLGSVWDPHDFDGIRAGPESEFDFAKTLESFCPWGQKICFIWLLETKQ